MTVETLGQLYVILGSDRGLIAVALHRKPPKRPLVMLCGAPIPTPRPQRGLARISHAQRRRLLAGKGA